jgi:hypothetical protein
MRSVSLSVLVLLAFATEARATCHFTGYPFQFGMDVTYTGTCDAKGTMIGISTGALVIESLQVAEPPRHGRAGVRGLGKAGYLPQPGYHGPDHFVIRVCGSSAVSKGCSNLSYDLTTH